MYVVPTFFLAILITAKARISINVETGRDLSNIIIRHTGSDEAIIGNKEMEQFKIDTFKLKQAVRNTYNAMPTDVFLKSPTPWGDLYERYHWRPVTRVLKIKSAKVTGSSIKSVVVLTQDFENLSHKTIKVDAGISQTVQNTVTSTWTNSKEVTVSQEVGFDFGFQTDKVSGVTKFAFSSTTGRSQQKSEAVTLGTSSNVETQLKPGQTATAVLSATRSTLNIEVQFSLTLRGTVAVNFRKRYRGHHFWGPLIENVLRSGHLQTEVTFVGHIEIGLFTDASLKVYDKKSRALLLKSG